MGECRGASSLHRPCLLGEEVARGYESLVPVFDLDLVHGPEQNLNLADVGADSWSGESCAKGAGECERTTEEERARKEGEGLEGRDTHVRRDGGMGGRTRPAEVTRINKV